MKLLMLLQRLDQISDNHVTADEQGDLAAAVKAFSGSTGWQKDDSLRLELLEITKRLLPKLKFNRVVCKCLLTVKDLTEKNQSVRDIALP